jgi:hypothetical protein
MTLEERQEDMRVRQSKPAQAKIQPKGKRSGKTEYYIYFIQGALSERIKIGIATCPNARLKDMQAGCTERLTIIGTLRTGTTDRMRAEQMERNIHDQFKHCHAFAEVFECTQSLLELAKTGTEHKCRYCPSDMRIKSPWERCHVDRLTTPIAPYANTVSNPTHCLQFDTL